MSGWRRPLWILLVAVVLAACGGTGEPGHGADVAQPMGTPPPRPLPSVEVRDLADGATVDLAGLLPADRPLLVWFWAPH